MRKSMHDYLDSEQGPALDMLDKAVQWAEECHLEVAFFAEIVAGVPTRLC